MIAIPILSHALSAQVMFTHESGANGIAGKRDNDLLAKPDPGDVFYSQAKLGKPSDTKNYGNLRIFDDGAEDIPAFWLGISADDHIDSLQIGVVNIFEKSKFDLNLAFSVAAGASGAPGSRVALDAPDNGAHIYSSSGIGWNANCINALQMGLTDGSDIGSLSSDRTFKRLVKDPTNTPMLFTLSAGSPFLAAAAVSPADVLFVVPGPMAFPARLLTAASLGLDGDDEIDAMAIIAPDAITHASEPYVLLFSVGVGADGLPGTAVASGGAADIFWSVGDGTNHLYRSAEDLGLSPSDDIDALDVFIQGKVRHPEGEKIAHVAAPEGCARGGLQIAIRGGDGPGYLSMQVRVRASDQQELVLTTDQVEIDSCREPIEIQLGLLFLMAQLRVTDPVSGTTTPVFTPPTRARVERLDGLIVETSVEMRPHPLLHALQCAIVGAEITFGGDCQAATLTFPKLRKDQVTSTEFAFFLQGTATGNGNLLLQLNGEEAPIEVAVGIGDDHDSMALKIAAQLTNWNVIVTPGQPLKITGDSEQSPILSVDMVGFDSPNLGLGIQVALQLL